jgi:hypothetical protein
MKRTIARCPSWLAKLNFLNGSNVGVTSGIAARTVTPLADS